MQHILVSHNSSIRMRELMYDGCPQLYKVCLSAGGGTTPGMKVVPILFGPGDLRVKRHNFLHDQLAEGEGDPVGGPVPA